MSFDQITGKYISDPIKEKASDPFWGPFLFSFLIINYKIFIHLAKDAVSQTAIDNIQALLRDHWCHAFIAPLISASLWVFVWPFMKRKLSVWLIKIKTEEENQKRDIQNNTDSRVVISNLNAEIDGLLKNILNLKTVLNESKSTKQLLESVSGDLQQKFGPNHFNSQQVVEAIKRLSTASSFKFIAPLSENGELNEK